MHDDRNFEKWASGVLGVVCLVLIWNLASRFNQPRAAVSKPTNAVSLTSRPRTATRRDSSRLAGRGNDAVDEIRTQPRDTKASVNRKRPIVHAKAAENASFVSKRSAPSPSNRPVVVPEQASAPPPGPVVTELKPLGYVELSDGRLEAVVSEGNQVFIVHEGDKFNDRYRVLKVSASAVEVADELAPHEGPTSIPAATLAASQKTVEYPPAEPSHQLAVPHAVRSRESRRVARVVPNSGETLPSQETPRATPAPRREVKGGFAPREPEEHLGYVELAGGVVKSIIAAGNRVELVPQGEAVAQELPTSEEAELTVKASPPWQASRASIDQAVPSVLSTQDSALLAAVSSDPPATESPPGIPVELRAICYVEKADGSTRAIVASGSHAYFVREGDIFADRFRVRSISPSAIEVEDESAPQGVPSLKSDLEPEDIGASSSSPLMVVSHSPPERPPPRSNLATEADSPANENKEAEVALEGLSLPEEASLGEPTSSDSESSTSSVEVNSGKEDLGVTWMLESTEVLPAWGVPGGGNNPRSSLASFSGATGVVQTPKKSGLPAITLLPLEVTSQLLTLPGLPDGVGSSVKVAAVKLQAGESGLPPASTGGGAEMPILSGIALGSAPGVGVSTGARAWGGTGFGLLLEFSIGDNACHLPR